MVDRTEDTRTEGTREGTPTGGTRTDGTPTGETRIEEARTEGIDSEGIGPRTAWGIVWAFLSMSAGKVVSLLGLAILARLLTPEDFGVLAFALVFITYVETLGDLGTGAALIYWPRRQDDAAQLTFAVNATMGVAWFAVCLLAAPGVAAFFQNPAGEPVLRAMAWVFPLKYLATTHDALLQRRIRFKTRAVAEIGFAVVKLVVAVSLAWAGFGVWSLVWGQVAGQAASSVALWIVVPWRPGLRLPLDLLGPMLRYGRGLVAVNVLSAVVHHFDLVVVGRMLGATALGLYQVAVKIPEMTITLIIWVVGRVLFPAFSRIHASGKKLEDAYLTTLRYVSAATLPAAVGLALLADPVVDTVFGAGWSGAAPILRALAVYAGLRSLGTQAGDVLKGTGRSGLLAGIGAVKAALLVPALLYAGRFGAAAVAWTLAGLTVLTASLSVGVVCHLYSMRPLRILRAIQPGLLGASVLALFLVGWKTWVTAAQGPVALTTTVAAGAVTYLLTLYLVDHEIYRRAWSGLDLGRLADDLGQREGRS